MKVCVIQPRYSTDTAELDACLAEELSLLSQCDASMDLIVLPEYADIPAAVQGAEGYASAMERNNARVLAAAAETARRCHALLFVNCGERTEAGWRNTTHAFDREGNEAGRYYKAHPAPSELRARLDCAYSYEYREPQILELEGIRFGFMTCYDFYMYEAYSALARRRPDIIIGCSHQRTDTHTALDVFGRFLSYQTNAYLVRASVSLGENSPVCGCSMVTAPTGEMLLNLESRVGLGVCEIDPHKKYEKPAGFRGAPRPHHEYIDEGRRPWLYRPAGSMMVPSDRDMPYPRVCAHRGFNSVAPENSLPAFGAAVALGAQEIEFDVWATKDGALVSLHDRNLERVSNGTGFIWEHTLAELRAMDFGAKKGEAYSGLPIVTFEEILRKFACTCVMNIHVKIWSKTEHYGGRDFMEEIIALLRKYDCERHCYIMSNADEAMERFHALAPDIRRCTGFDGTKDDPCRIVDRAIRLGCDKVQLFKPYFDQSAVDKAHAHGILCNVFYADDPEEACRYLDMGIDCVLTNDYLRVSSAVKAHLQTKEKK